MYITKSRQNDELFSNTKNRNVDCTIYKWKEKYWSKEHRNITLNTCNWNSITQEKRHNSYLDSLCNTFLPLRCLCAQVVVRNEIPFKNLPPELKSFVVEHRAWDLDVFGSHDAKVIITPQKSTFFTDNIDRKVSLGQICPRFLRTCLSSILLRFCLNKKRTLSLLFLPNNSYPSPTQNGGYWEGC